MTVKEQRERPNSKQRKERHEAIRAKTPEDVATVTTQSLLKAAKAAAKEANIPSVLVCAGSHEIISVVENVLDPENCILAADEDMLTDDVRSRFKRTVDLPSINLTRLGQIKVALLLALTRNIIDADDVLICLAGQPRALHLDTMMLISVKDELELFTSGADLLSDDVKPEVFEQLVEIAIQLAVEGREGRPIGTMFVVGDSENVKKHVTQLVLNPFAGYDENIRSVLNPDITETIKEFSSIDGAFIIRGDGVVESAGSYIQPGVLRVEVPMGLGTRHMAAASITAVTNAIAITVSASTGTVRIFRSGNIVMEIERPRL
ncbi:MAG: diadenylate cyclase [Armatimonadetes bacterium]|nr:diadenylate cyclase [Armatimonadota bacterium]